MGYKKDDIINKCTEAFENKNTFYKQPFINYRGKTEDTSEYFTEVIAEFLCYHISEYINGFDTITRESSYKTESHNGVIKDYNSNREEEQIAMKMFDKEYDFIGKIIDYQTPLKNEIDDKAGKIDLLAFDGEIMRILELKKPDSEETMLRCVLEGFTYLKTVNHQKLADDFKKIVKSIKASPFVFKESIQHKEFKDMQNGNRPHLKKLMELLDSKPYFITEKYFVEE